MKISLENLLADIGTLSVVKKTHISLRAQKREEGEGERPEQKTKQPKSTRKKSKLKIHNRGNTFKRKKHGELHIQL